MSPYILSILLGIVEGLTEFLPVSSTAHLRIAEALMKIPLDDPYWMMYTIVIQVGAILALCLLFLERILDFMRTFPEGDKGDRNWLTHPISLTLVAFAFTSAPALLLRKWSERNLGSLRAMAIALLVGGIIMWVVDVWSTRSDPSTTARGRDVAAASHMDRPMPGAFRHLSGYIPFDVDHRRRPDCRT